jgi:hypothetical protein
MARFDSGNELLLLSAGMARLRRTLTGRGIGWRCPGQSFFAILPLHGPTGKPGKDQLRTSTRSVIAFAWQRISAPLTQAQALQLPGTAR